MDIVDLAEVLAAGGLQASAPDAQLLVEHGFDVGSLSGLNDARDRIDDDGICRVSVLAENNTSDDPYAIEFRNWIAEGNAPLPPDEPPVETP